ncbi:MAG: hypothetical protein JXR95_10065, partial [Deltaproteobacteria bacterium]|nr:hypothetical protein [Deltaproteobacteria bacterium]
VCGDTYCTHTEDASSCPGDCEAVCGDGYCTHTEDFYSCSADCAATRKTAFLTSTTYTGGEVGGLAGADAKCNAAAAAAGLPGVFRAWLSDETGSPSSRFNRSTVPYYRTDGVRIANNYNDIIDCSGVGCLAADLNVTEYGVSIGGYFNVWSSTNTDGTYVGRSCNNWSSSSSSYSLKPGRQAYHNYTWTYNTSVLSTDCSISLPLYCFEQ